MNIRDTYKIAVRIDIANERFFMANERISLVESFSSDTRRVFYQPNILTTELSDSTLSLDGSAPVFTLKVSATDADSKIKKAFEKRDYEQAAVFVTLINDYNDQEYFKGVLADVEYGDGKIDFVVRFSEDANDIDILDVFSSLTFEKYDVIVPSSVTYQGNFQQVPDVPWRVYRTEFNRVGMARQPRIIDGFFVVQDTGGRIDPQSTGNYVDRILLSPTTINAFRMKQWSIATADINTSQPGLEQYLEQTTKSFYLFRGFYSGPTGSSPPAPPQYYDAWIGPGHQWTDESSPEIFRYAWFGEGYRRKDTGLWVSTPGQFWLSGIPSANSSASFVPSTVDPAGLGAPWNTENFNYRLKKVHNPRDVVAPANDGAPGSISAGVDVVWMKANGFVPDEDDPDFGAGFLWLGKTYTAYNQKFLDSVEGRNLTYSQLDRAIQSFPGELQIEYKAFHRYKILEVIPDVYDYDADATVGQFDGGDAFTLIKIAIQDHPLDNESHPYALFDIPLACAHVDGDVDEENPVELYTYEYVINSIDILPQHLNNLEFEALFDLKEREKLKDRYRGVTFSMIRDFGLFRAGISNDNFFGLSQISTGQVQRQNANAINNATPLFGVSSGSEIIPGSNDVTTPNPGNVVERIYFHVPDISSRGFLVPAEPETDADVQEGTITGYSVHASAIKDKAYSNYLTYRPTYNTAEQQLGIFNYGRDQVKKFFTTAQYRVVIDPMPENSQDSGKYFPIVYGYVKRVPLIHAISKKSLYENNETSGDDFYVYASHPCNIKTPFDITLEIVVDNESRTLLSDDVKKQIQRSSLKDEFIKSPFPNVEQNHYFWSEGTTDPQGRKNSTIVRVNELYNPYHKLLDRLSNDGKLYYGVQLRGDEWDYRLGRLNKHYPVRNGLGNSTLYGSFSGYVDEDGSITGKPNSVITHPIDVITHYIKTYGKRLSSVYGLRFNDDEFIDMGSAEFVKSKTRKYEASVFVSDVANVSISNFIDSICRQFGIYWFLYGGKIYFSLGELDYIQWNKIVSERYNLIKSPKESHGGYKDIYTSVKYNYRYNYIDSAYEGLVYLNSSNNRYCSRNSRSLGSQKEYTIEGLYQNSYSTAKEVALKYAKYFCTRRITYQISVRKVDGQVFSPGDVIPMTYARYDMNQVPVLVSSVKLEKDVWNMTVIRFPDIETEYSGDIQPDPIPPDDDAPVNVILPVITGTVSGGETLTSTTGSWLNTPTSFAYQWQRNGVNIMGANSNTYLVTSSDMSYFITCVVTASNIAGSANATSNSLNADGLMDENDNLILTESDLIILLD